MTKRQWFLVTGTLVLSACGTGLAPCQFNEETGDSYCPGPVITEPAQTSPDRIDVPDPDQP